MKKLQFSFLALFVASYVHSQTLDLNNFTYRDYLDFGQNRGKFIPSQIPLTYEGKNSITQLFEKIPDFSHRSRSGATTSLGRNYVTTAYHVVVSAFKDSKQLTGEFKEPNAYLPLMQTWGLSQYDFGVKNNKPRDHKEYGIDTSYFRASKYIIEGKVDPAFVEDNIAQNNDIQKREDLYAECESMPFNDTKRKCWEEYDEPNSDINNFKQTSKEKLKKYYSKFNEAYQSGRGALTLKKEGFICQKEGEDCVISNMTNALSGGVWKIVTDVPENFGDLNFYSFFNFKEYGGKREGFIFRPFMTKPNTKNDQLVKFKSGLFRGDSGSGIVAWDEDEQKWVLLGVTSAGGLTNEHADFSVTIQEEFNDYKKNFEHSFNQVVNQSDLQPNKDNIFKVAQHFSLNSDLNLATGGLVFTTGKNILDGNNHNISEIAGVDVEKGAELTLNNVVLNKKDLHKVGDGSLIVDARTNGNLRFGSGEVVLKNSNAFDKIYNTGGKLKLDSHFNVQDNLFFGDRGGILDLNSQNLSIKNFSVNNNRALIQNSHNTPSTLTIENSEDNKNLIHAFIGGKIYNKISKIDIKPNNSNNIFDGGFEIDGDVNVLAGKTLNLQGHPTLHAYFKGVNSKQDFTAIIKDHPDFVLPKKPANPCSPEASTNKLEQYYVNSNQREKVCLNYLSLKLDGIDLSRPNRLEQTDWDFREYKAKNITLKKGATLNLSKSSATTANITATNATVNIGGNLTHYIDKFDGENTYKNGYSFQQEVESKNINAGTVTFNGNITQKSGNINANNAQMVVDSFILDNGVFNAQNNTQSTIKNFTLLNNNTVTTDASILNIENLNIDVVSNNQLSANMNISGILDLKNVGKDDSTLKDTENDLVAVRNNKKITFKSNSKISVTFSEFLKANSQKLKLDTVYKLIVANDLDDQRQVREINFKNLLNQDIKSYNKTEGNAIYVIFKNKNLPDATENKPTPTPDVIVDEKPTPTPDVIVEDKPTPTPDVIVEDKPTPTPDVIVEDKPTPTPDIIVEEKPIPTPDVIVEDKPAPTPDVIVEDKPTPTPDIIVEEKPAPTPDVIVEEKPAPTPDVIVEDKPAPTPDIIVEEKPTPTPDVIVEDKPTPTPDVIVEDKPTLAPKKPDIQISSKYQAIYEAFDKRGIDKLALNSAYKNNFDKAIFAYQTGEKNAQSQLDNVLKQADDYLQKFANIPNTIAPQILWNNYTKINQRMQTMWQNKVLDNDLWVDVNGIITKNSYHNLNLGGITLGYDHRRNLEKGNSLIGGFLSYQGGIANNDFYNSDIHTLSLGGYANYIYHNLFEVGGQVNAIYENHSPTYNKLSFLQQDLSSRYSAYSVGLNLHYKHNVYQNTIANYTHTLKPVATLGVLYSKIGTQKTVVLKQQKSNVIHTRIGGGLEYSIANENTYYNLNAMVKKEFNYQDNKAISFVNMSEFSPYSIKLSNPVRFELNFDAGIKLNKQTSLQLLLGGFVTDKKDLGLNSTLKFNVEF
ncbi:S6 family peptidase [Pasteurella atlantica]|uniref:S6 family peptidase n=2 Tax=Pasteurellaceae TaxID=712 RepID=A0ACC6HN30_9PAST|nr:S6 family peptidase [Pasteurella atlantica]MDP8052218.1 S6 family peptidase [Pasteurella atlantica]MDP8105676.1 S6 family peptidase [Pasteurella atlantica]MDP8149064.1 S6 family peptidase [Pasteurella atlantica]